MHYSECCLHRYRYLLKKKQVRAVLQSSVFYPSKKKFEPGDGGISKSRSRPKDRLRIMSASLAPELQVNLLVELVRHAGDGGRAHGHAGRRRRGQPPQQPTTPASQHFTGQSEMIFQAIQQLHFFHYNTNRINQICF